MKNPLPPWNPEDLERLRRRQNPEKYGLPEAEKDQRIQPEIEDDREHPDMEAPPSPDRGEKRGVENIQLGPDSGSQA